MPLNIKSTEEIKVPKRIAEQVVGQDKAVEVIKKAAGQRRHVLLIGEPGTGKSMIGLALAELLPKEKLVDILSFPNPNDENQPLIRVVPAGKGREIVAKSRLQSMSMFKNQNLIIFILVIIAMFAPWWVLSHYKEELGVTAAAIMFSAFFLGGMLFLAAFILFINIGKKMSTDKVRIPKVIVDNFKKKQAPFFDATGAHAGALLGDVLHDPFQSFCPSQVVTKVKKDGVFNDVKLIKKIDILFSKHKNEIEKKENYEAIHLPKNELFVLGENNGSISPVEVLSSNRYDYTGEMIKLTTSENKELIVTPEHKIAIHKNGKIAYVEARNIKENDEIVSKSEDIIIDEQDIINTYDKRQQELSKSYYNYLKLKKQNPSWGYKRIATKLGVSYGRTRWWWDNNSAPVPVQTVEWLKKKGLIPLKIDNLKLPFIAKVIGATFGDGGIFENLNGIFLLSSNYHDVNEFSKDLQKIFGSNVLLNTELREGGEYGHSWCLTNTNRNIIRLFLALGTPKGNKANNNLVIPEWIKLRKGLQDEFYGSLFGSELGISRGWTKWIPRVEFAVTGLENLERNRICFLNEIISYLDNKDVKITKGGIDVRHVKTKNGRKGNKIYRFHISQDSYNVEKFYKNIKINYCNLKKYKLMTTVDRDKKDKLMKYLDLRAKGLGAESIMKRLQINQKYLYRILNNTSIDLKKVEATI